MFANAIVAVIISGIPLLFGGAIFRIVVVRRMATVFGPERTLDGLVARRYGSEFPADPLTSQLRLANWLCGLGAFFFLGGFLIAGLILFRNVS